MHNLTPEPRADINGKITTRWVRNASQGTSKALLSALPAAASPALPPATEDSAPLSALALLNVFDSEYGDYTVSDFNPLAIQRIEESLAEARRNEVSQYLKAEQTFVKVLYDARDNTGKWGSSPENSTLINDIAVLDLRISGNPMLMVAGVRTHPEFENVPDFLSLDAKGQEKVRALYSVIGSVGDRYREEYFLDEDDYEEEPATWQEEDTQFIRLRNPDLSQFVVDHPELHEYIIQIVKTRRTDDLDVIKEILNTEAQALGEGYL